MKLTAIALRGAMLLCVALAATGCSALRPSVRLSEPEIVRVPGPVRYVPVPAELTAETPEPAAPVPLCVDQGGFHVLCNRQLDGWREAYGDALRSCNADKSAIATLPIEGSDGR